MHRSRLVAVAATLLLVVPSIASADGPFEPNETAAEAYGPLTGGSFSGAFETPQDHDWYRFYAFNHRQIGVLLTLTSSCAASYASIELEVLDGESNTYAVSMGS